MYREGVPSSAASSGKKEKQFRINIQKTLEYLEGGNEVIPKSSPLQGMKAQSLQSFFVGEVTHASYKPCIHSLNSLWLVDICNEQAGIPYSRCGRTKAPYKWMKADFERSWKERVIMKINRLALFAAAVH